MGGEPSREDVLSRSLSLLEWPELCKWLSRHAASPRGVRICETLFPESSERSARRLMGLTSEWVEILTREEKGPLSGFEDLQPAVKEAARGKRLAGSTLRSLGEFLDMAERVRSFFQKRAHSAPTLADLSSALRELSSLRADLMGAFESDGKIREEAFPRLAALRQEVRGLRAGIIGRLEALMRDRQSAKYLQDTYYTVREGRYVLPVRSDGRGAVGGIVHDVSSSGSTLFLEPPWLVEMNNALRLAELETQREIERILDGFCRRVAEKAPDLEQNLEIMTQLDVARAKALLSMEIHGSEPTLGGAGDLALWGLRHPLLVLRRVPVVSNDLILDPAERVLLVSGPNAGGKTVLLKAVGLAALMVRAGMYTPSNPGSRIPFFGQVFADIGDQQDLHEDVSTFSAHMRNLRQILEWADGSTLALLDELAGSTDPQEGAALAQAVLELLIESGAYVFATTHYTPLKAWAQGRQRVRNGALEFDWDRMEPTYRLRMGVPGRSSALEIAKKMGLPSGLVERARNLLERGAGDSERLLRELESRIQGLEEEENRVSRLRGMLEASVAEQEALALSLRREHEEFSRQKRSRLSREIQEARRKLREINRALRHVRDREGARALGQSLRALDRETMPPPLSPPRPPRPLGEVRPGDPVEVIPLGRLGILLDDPEKSRGRLRVRVGGKEVLVERALLGGAARGAAEALQKDGRGARMQPPGFSPEVPPEIDVRGMTVEDALDALERYLDRALLGGRVELRVIHGHGAGALKRAVRDWASKAPYVAAYRGGERYEGGDGVTVVKLEASVSEPDGD